MSLRWFTIGIGVKRWLLLLLGGIVLTAFGFANVFNRLGSTSDILQLSFEQIVFVCFLGFFISALALLKLSRNLLAPYRKYYQGHVVDVVYAHSKRHKGLHVVAIGGGTGLPSVLRG